MRKSLTIEDITNRIDTSNPNRKYRILSRTLKTGVIKKEKLYVQDEFGICLISASSLIRGSNPSIKSAVFRGLYSKNQFRKVHGFKYDYTKTKYLNSHEYLNVVCKKHGNFKIKAYVHMNGSGCVKCYLENLPKYRSSNTKEFIKKAVKRLNTDVSMYDKAVYKDAKSDILIYCKEHNGYYKTTPNKHLNGIGCPKCAFERRGFGRSDFIKSSRGRACVLYVIHCYNKEESFIKIGITSNSVKKRFSNNLKMPYKYRVLKVIKNDNPDYIYDLENRVQNKFRDRSYKPKKLFKGWTECYKL